MTSNGLMNITSGKSMLNIFTLQRAFFKVVIR